MNYKHIHLQENNFYDKFRYEEQQLKKEFLILQGMQELHNNFLTKPTDRAQNYLKQPPYQISSSIKLLKTATITN